ncbi:MAG: LON peptidase substrate-binding domain-containing protein, partial [Actinomycetes bacterium]
FLPLHIFEPRYRLLVEDLLARPDEAEREFGIVAIRDGYDVDRDGMAALHPIGTATVLRQAERLPDGRFDIVTTGSRRFRIVDVDASRPLLIGAVEFLEDVSDPADVLLASQVGARFRDYRAALSGQVAGGAADVGDGSQPLDDDEDGLPDDPTVLSYLVTAAMLLQVDERQRLLAAPTTGERLALARALLARETGLISTLSAVPALDLPGAPPSAN